MLTFILVKLVYGKTDKFRFRPVFKNRDEMVPVYEVPPELKLLCESNFQQKNYWTAEDRERCDQI